jgi:hypothetical protein
MRDDGGTGGLSFMSETSCPTCGQTLQATAPDVPTTPDPSVLDWFRAGPRWIGETSTDEIYTSYLRAVEGVPVSRRRFVADLAYLGVEEVLDDATHLLIRT